MTDYRSNRFLIPMSRSRANGAARAFHQTLPGYQPTPLHLCDGLAASLGIGRVLVKDESQRFGLGAFKALGASWALERLRQSGGLPGTVAAATEGNHGRAVAWSARRLGIEAVIFIPADAAPARVENLRREGARVELVPGGYDDAVAMAAERSRENGWQVISDTGYGDYLTIPQWIAEGYSTLFEEADQQMSAAGLTPDVVVIQAGVGSLLHAAVDHFRAAASPPRIVAVEPVQADGLFQSIGSPDGSPQPASGSLDSIMAGLNCREVSRAAWPAIRRGVDLFITIENRHTEGAMRKLARPVPGDPEVVAGESGAAGLGGLIALMVAPELGAARAMLELGPRSTVLLVNTEGATDPEGYARVVRPGA